MTAEELTLVMTTLQTLGEDGKAAFVWWLVFDKLMPVLGWMATLGVAAFIAKMVITACVRSATPDPHSPRETHLRVLRDRMGIGAPGSLTEVEFMAMIVRIDELMLERKQ